MSALNQWQKKINQFGTEAKPWVKIFKSLNTTLFTNKIDACLFSPLNYQSSWTGVLINIETLGYVNAACACI